jgi:hypothetical protein
LLQLRSYLDEEQAQALKTMVCAVTLSLQFLLCARRLERFNRSFRPLQIRSNDPLLIGL